MIDTNEQNKNSKNYSDWVQFCGSSVWKWLHNADSVNLSCTKTKKM
jgi:hypothetical protein